MAGGRPTDYTEDKALIICAHIAEGKSLVSICKQDDMPSTVTVYAWLRDKEGFLNMYTRAREDQADSLADEITAIADEAEVVAKSDGEDVILALDSTAIARNRLRVDARKWVAAKLKPRKYGDKVTTEVTGKDGGAIQTEHKLDISPLTDDQLRAIASIAIKSE